MISCWKWIANNAIKTKQEKENFQDGSLKQRFSQSSNSIRKKPNFLIFHGFFPYSCHEYPFKMNFLRKIDIFFFALSFEKEI